MNDIKITETFDFNLCRDVIGIVEEVEYDAQHPAYASADAIICATSG